MFPNDAASSIRAADQLVPKDVSMPIGVSKTTFINLNMVRALSGFVVVFSHFFQLFVMPVEGRSFGINLALASSEYAVLTFFTLSGFLIALSINRNILSHGYFAWKEYFISRVARIYPALIASVFLCLFLYGILRLLGMVGPDSLNRVSDVYPASRSEFTMSKFEILSTLIQAYSFGPGGYIGGYINANGPLWSLSYEVGFYLAAGLLMTVISGREIARFLSAICFVGLVLGSIQFEKFLFFHYGTIWALGVGLFFVLERMNRPRNQTSFLTKGDWVLSLLFLLLTITNILFSLTGIEGSFIENYASSFLITALLFGLTRLRSSISSGLAQMADSTYTLYLFHFPMMLFFYAIIRDIYDQSPILYFSLACMFTIGLIPLIHRLAKFLENRRLWEKVMKTFI